MRHFTATPAGSRRIELCQLSPREREVLRLVAQGLPSKEIAYLLEISVRTVKKYVGNLIEGLGLKNRYELGIWAIQHPQALNGHATPAGIHPPGCACGGAYCAALRPAEENPPELVL